MTFRSLLLLFSTIGVAAQPMFSEQTSLLTGSDFFSGAAMAIVDMDGDELDDIVCFNNSQVLSIEPQLPGGGFGLPAYTNALGAGT